MSLSRLWMRLLAAPCKKHFWPKFDEFRTKNRYQNLDRKSIRFWMIFHGFLYPESLISHGTVSKNALFAKARNLHKNVSKWHQNDLPNHPKSIKKRIRKWLAFGTHFLIEKWSKMAPKWDLFFLSFFTFCWFWWDLGSSCALGRPKYSKINECIVKFIKKSIFS